MNNSLIIYDKKIFIETHVKKMLIKVVMLKSTQNSQLKTITHTFIHPGKNRVKKERSHFIKVDINQPV